MKEKDEQLRRFEELKLKAQQEEEARVMATMADFEEDWNHSQVGISTHSWSMSRCVRVLMNWCLARRR